MPLSQGAPLLLSLEERTDQVRYVFLKFDKGDSERGHDAADLEISIERAKLSHGRLVLRQLIAP